MHVWNPCTKAGPEGVMSGMKCSEREERGAGATNQTKMRKGHGRRTWKVEKEQNPSGQHLRVSNSLSSSFFSCRCGVLQGNPPQIILNSIIFLMGEVLRANFYFQNEAQDLEILTNSVSVNMHLDRCVDTLCMVSSCKLASLQPPSGQAPAQVMYKRVS